MSEWVERHLLAGRGSKMATQIRAAAVLILCLPGGVAARAEGPPSPIRRASRGDLAIEMKAGGDGRNLVGVEALPGGRIGFHVKVSGQDVLKLIVESLPGDRLRIVDRDDHSLECTRLALNLARDEPTRGETRQRERLDELDEARVNVELLEMEVDADRDQIRKMVKALNEAELQGIPGFADLTSTRSKFKIDIDEYKKRLAEVRSRFADRSTKLARERRRLAELEKGVTIASTPPPAPTPREFGMKDVDRALDLILRGVETWQRSAAPAPSPAERPSMDAERLLDLIRKGVEAWQQSPSPSSSSSPPALTPTPTPTPPQGRPSTDAERIFELFLKGIEHWQRQ